MFQEYFKEVIFQDFERNISTAQLFQKSFGIFNFQNNAYKNE